MWKGDNGRRRRGQSAKRRSAEKKKNCKRNLLLGHACPLGLP